MFTSVHELVHFVMNNELNDSFVRASLVNELINFFLNGRSFFVHFLLLNRATFARFFFKYYKQMTNLWHYLSTKCKGYAYYFHYTIPNWLIIYE